MPEHNALTSKQRSLKDEAVRQLEVARTTLKRLHRLPADQGDTEAVGDAIDAVKTAQTLLVEWYGGEPIN